MHVKSVRGLTPPRRIGKNDTVVPVRIILKSNLLCRSLPIPNFPTRGINHLVMIILFPHTFRNHGTSLEVNSLPGTHLSVNVCQTKREEC